MRYFCAPCGKYWANREPRYTIADPVRCCPDCLAKAGKRWVDAGKAWQEEVGE